MSMNQLDVVIEQRAQQRPSFHVVVVGRDTQSTGVPAAVRYVQGYIIIYLMTKMCASLSSNRVFLPYYNIISDDTCAQSSVENSVRLPSRGKPKVIFANEIRIPHTWIPISKDFPEYSLTS